MHDLIEAERDQLIATWKHAFKGSGWMTDNRAHTRRLMDPDEKKFGMAFRKCHNEFGWKASETLDKLGLCSGAIYRTEKFMLQHSSKRSGSKRFGQTVHIEHTVPIAELNRQWGKYRFGRVPTLAETFAWVLFYSVSTAFDIREKGGIKRYESRNDAFLQAAPEYGRPFMRYNRMAEPPTIWNVLTRQEVVREEWSFRNNFAMIETLFEEARCDKEVTRSLKAEARKFLHFNES
ncbi:hypothetical protein [Rhizobium sp. L245/93]|uniref:hypothetical protein n=1 Tax=Rhizobium sp. L245/93 TaxID=2819998 RepID=UPI001ADB71C7|nr:hypothetical protein [Rhizobium sp. L245/93]MBO9170023.1 hypothetical protein [Rhizobium sp. L245/93]